MRQMEISGNCYFCNRRIIGIEWRILLNYHKMDYWAYNMPGFFCVILSSKVLYIFGILSIIILLTERTYGFIIKQTNVL